MTVTTIVALILFWVSLAGIFQTYFGLYCLLRILNLFTRKTPSTEKALSDSEYPSVTVIVPAFNEEDCIGERINNLLAQDYPADKLTIWVGSDCSTDQTNAIVNSIADPRVSLHVMPDRRGKLGIIDTLTPLSPGEIVIITDANVHFEPNTIRHLTAPFTDQRVGGVTGNLKTIPPSKTELIAKEVAYRNFESDVKLLLGNLGKLFGAYGGFYAFRRELFQPFGLRPVQDDIIQPLEILAQGRRFVFAANAIASEDTSETVQQEFSRRVRMMGYNMRSMGRALRLASRAGIGALFLFVSYKILRWLSPFLFGLLAITSLLLIQHSPFYATFVLLIAIFFACAVIGALGRMTGITIPGLSSAYYFALMNFASYVGLLKLWQVKRYWNPRS